MKDERLTWLQIKEKYPHKWVGLTDVEYKEDGVNIKSAVVSLTSDEKSYDEIMELYLTRKIVAMYTTLDEDEIAGVLEPIMKGEKSYDFYKKIAKILAKDNAEQLFQYIIHSMDYDGGFLRTRYCYWDKTLDNFIYSLDDVKTVLITLKAPFDFENSTDYYEEWYGETATKVKMQLYFDDMSDDAKFKQETLEAAMLGYSYPIRIDMENETYEILDYVKNPYIP